PARALHDRDHARVAPEPPRRLCGQRRTALELAAPRRALAERLRSDVHDDLMPIASGDLARAVSEEALGDRTERIRAERPPLRGRLGRSGRNVRLPGPLLDGRLDRLDEERPDLRGQLTVED